ncbi:MAG TPA: cysteine--tRNA ligase [Aestuariivirgaceae bacterium]|jgi:cysteinyl-tRNA synthetase
MTLRLHNTLTRSKELFAPLDPNNVRLYVCGPTVYDFAHIGNARPIIVFDVLFRLLRALYGPEHVTYVRNVTDVDDKINARAAEESIPIRELTERTLDQFNKDVGSLGVLSPTFEPRATETIPEMIDIIERLLAAGCAYEAQGHVLFDVSSMKDYGQLSGRSLDEMIAGARVEVAPYKNNPMDFVLWKPSTGDLPGWESPWGRGRPGWHIECSAMSWKYLGETFDIHAGGIDLVFPHHENELAQSRCAFSTPLMARVWMHNGFLQVEGRKMAKSESNFITIRDLLADWPGEVLRFNMLRTHYRQPMDWTVRGLEESLRMLTGFYSSPEAQAVEARLHESVREPLLDDLNTPEAINQLHDLDKQGKTRELAQSLKALGFAGNLADPRRERIDSGTIEALIAKRHAARAARNWQESDRIRDELLSMGIILKDSKHGTSWEIKR